MKNQLLIFIIIAMIQAAPGYAQSSHDNVSGIELNNINRQINPGDDFYRYVNGNWLTHKKIAEDHLMETEYNRLADKALMDSKAIIDELLKRQNPIGTEEQQIADLYTSYMDVQTRDSLGIQPLQPLLDEIDKINNVHSLTQFFARTVQLGGSAPFTLQIIPDDKHPDQYMPLITQSGLGLPGRDYYLSDDNSNKRILTEYTHYIRSILKVAGEQKSEQLAIQIAALETKLARIQWDDVNLSDREARYNHYTINELKELSSNIDWDSYFSISNMVNPSSLNIGQPSYLAGLDDILEDTPYSIWRAYMKFHLLADYAPYLDQSSEQQSFAFFGIALNGVPKSQARWKRGVNLLNTFIGEPLGKRYVERHFSADAKARMNVLVENLRQAYRVSIQQVDWMSATTRQRALDKLSKLRIKIGHPDKWQDYSPVRINANELVGNIQRIKEYNYQNSLVKLDKPVDHDEWAQPPQSVNIDYNAANNEIVLPAAILQPPFFNLMADDAVNYGAIGAVIGHEISHGFDDQGANFDGDGVMHEWWQPQDLQQFQNHSQKLIAEYNRFTPLPGQPINGLLTLNENIGDLSGVSMAFKAYQLSLQGKPDKKLDGFTGEQRFFIGWAMIWKSLYRPEVARVLLKTDTHSPPQYRVNGILPNLAEFYEAFAITQQHKLYIPPEKRVKIW